MEDTRRRGGVEEGSRGEWAEESINRGEEEKMSKEKQEKGRRGEGD